MIHYGTTALLLLLIVLLGVLIYNSLPAPLHDETAEPRQVTPRGDLGTIEQEQIELFRAASPSVVHITSLNVGRDRFSLNVLEIPRGTGSGIVWDEQGNIVTNLHVIRGAQVARVSLSDNSSFEARLVGYDAESDIAVLKIDASEEQLRPIPIGQSSELQVGQRVFAIGNPFGLDQTLTTGVVSGLGRTIQPEASNTPIHDVIQTDAAINPGNSGGPLLDSAGRLIGVNTAIYSPSGAYAGVGFAVPVDTVNRVVPQLIQNGRVEQAGLGIRVFGDPILEQLQRKNVINRDGVLVLDVMEHGAAHEAGMRPTRRSDDGQVQLGDLIVAIDGEPVAGSEDLFRLLGQHDVGNSVRITVVREGEELDLEAALQALPTISP
ncbi:MAG: S1C family serine protease [Planctomycetaceae bacterium]